MEPRDPRPLTPPDPGPTAVEVAIEHLYGLEPCCGHFILHAEVEPWADLDEAREAVAADLPEWCNRCAVDLVESEFADTESFLAALRRPTVEDVAAVLDRFGVAVDGLAEALVEVADG